MSGLLHSLYCPACQHKKLVGYSEKLRTLHALGKLRRAKNPEPDLVQELFVTSLPQLSCSGCGSADLELRSQVVEEEDPEFWGEARRCEVCREPLMPERLEIFPDTVRCAACLSKPDPETEDDFCPSCGDRLTTRLAGGGLTRYRRSCPSCG